MLRAFMGLWHLKGLIMGNFVTGDAFNPNAQWIHLFLMVTLPFSGS